MMRKKIGEWKRYEGATTSRLNGVLTLAHKHDAQRLMLMMISRMMETQDNRKRRDKK